MPKAPKTDSMGGVLGRGLLQPPRVLMLFCSQMTSPATKNRVCTVFHFIHFCHACKNDYSITARPTIFLPYFCVAPLEALKSSGPRFTEPPEPQFLRLLEQSHAKKTPQHKPSRNSSSETIPRKWGQRQWHFTRRLKQLHHHFSSKNSALHKEINNQKLIKQNAEKYTASKSRLPNCKACTGWVS